jgi:hypothetical protein
MLPPTTRDHEYCRRNSVSSSRLKAYRLQQDGWHRLISVIRSSGKAEIRNLMETVRRVLWNFDNAVSGTGTVEFRGGRYLRGSVRTKRRIAFAIAYVHLFVTQAICRIGHLPHVGSTRDVYIKIRKSAQQLNLGKHLPQDYTMLNETTSSPGTTSSSRAPRQINTRDNRLTYAVLVICRSLQMVDALTVVGLYAGRLAGHSADSIYAVVVAGLSAVVVIARLSLIYRRKKWGTGWICDAILFYVVPTLHTLPG